MKNYTYQKYNWKDISKSQKELFESIELDILPLVRIAKVLEEAQMTDGQIEKLFSNAEKISKEHNLKTGFGKALSLPYESLIKVNSVLGKFGKKLQDSTPVKGFDAKFDQIKEALKLKLASHPAGRQAMAMVDSLGNAAKEHPIWQGAIIGLLTAVSSLALGPGSIPIIATVLKGTVELIKGEKISTAAGKGLYAGTLGYLGASIVHGLSSWFEGMQLHSIAPVGPKDLGFEKMGFDAKSVSNSNGMQWTKWFKIADAIVDQPTKAAINDAILRMGSGDVQAYDQLLGLAKKISSPEYLAGLKSQLSSATADKISNDAFLKSIKDIGQYATAAAGGTGSGAASATTEGVNLTLPIMEGMWADLTLQFGAGKLMKAWNAMGKPTDSVDIARMLADMGMTATDIRYLFLRTGLSDEDVDATMTAMHNSEDELQLPFTSGIPKYDDEARNMLKTHGEPAFISYWEGKVKEIEDEIAKQTTPVATAVDVAEPATDGLTTGQSTQASTTSAADIQGPISSNSSQGKQLANNIKAALAVKDAATVRELLSSSKQMSVVMKKKLTAMIDQSALNKKDKARILSSLNKAVVTEKEMFDTISSELRENNMSWKQLGYEYIVNEEKSNSVILIELEK